MEFPLRILRPFFGARIMKTGLAVFIALAAFHWIGSQHATFAAVAAIMAVQPSISRARTVFAQQLLGNLIGGTVAAIVGLCLGNSPLGMALGVVLSLGICSRFGLTESASLAVIAVLYIMDRPDGGFLSYTAVRVAVIAAGMSIGYLINRYVKPPDFTARVKEEVRSAHEGVAEFSAHLLASLASPESFEREQIKAETAAIDRHLEAATNYLELYQESNPSGEHLRALDRARSALNVHVERLADIHRIILQAGGLRPGTEFGAVAAVMKALDRYRSAAVQAVLEDGEVDESVAAECRQAAEHLSSLVDQLVDQRERRERGLVLHSILTNLRHMVWRLDALAEVLENEHAAADR